MQNLSAQTIPLQISSGCVIASIQIDLSDEVLSRFRTDLLEQVRRIRAKGVIIDVSGLQIMDLDDFNGLRLTMAMAAVMGARPVLYGLRPGVVSALIDLGVEVDDIDFAMNLDDAFGRLGATLDSTVSATKAERRG